jgi:hypothetical protein
MRNNTQKESVMDKFKRYDIELGDDGFWNRCLVVDESYNGDWVRYSEVRDEIEKLEAEIQRLKVKSGETVKEVKTKKRVNEWSNWRETGR